MWIFLEVDGISFRIINVYAPNNAFEYFSLWRWCALSLPPPIWLMCSDFNMMLRELDKYGVIPNIWAIREI